MLTSSALHFSRGCDMTFKLTEPVYGKKRLTTGLARVWMVEDEKKLDDWGQIESCRIMSHMQLPTWSAVTEMQLVKTSTSNEFDFIDCCILSGNKFFLLLLRQCHPSSVWNLSLAATFTFQGLLCSDPEGWLKLSLFQTRKGDDSNEKVSFVDDQLFSEATHTKNCITKRWISCNATDTCKIGQKYT